jgi:hypothetical protein
MIRGELIERRLTTKIQNHKKECAMVKYFTSTVLAVLLVLAHSPIRANDSYAMTKEQLLPLLGKSDLIIIDVRTKYDWDNSKVKIPGAVKQDGMKFGSWMKKCQFGTRISEGRLGKSLLFERQHSERRLA